MGKLIIKSEKKPCKQKKPCVAISEEVYYRLKNLSKETGCSMIALTNRMIEYAFNNLEVIQEVQKCELLSKCQGCDGDSWQKGDNLL